jgi:cytochrome c
MGLSWWAAAAFLAVPNSAWSQACDRRAFEPCRACHALTADAGVKPGPQLSGLIGRPVAGDPAFDYSPAMRAGRAQGHVWTRERLDLFLADPQEMYPGQWMGSPAIRDAQARADLLCVLGAR